MHYTSKLSLKYNIKYISIYSNGIRCMHTQIVIYFIWICSSMDIYYLFVLLSRGGVARDSSSVWRNKINILFCNNQYSQNNYAALLKLLLSAKEKWTRQKTAAERTDPSRKQISKKRNKRIIKKILEQSHSCWRKKLLRSIQQILQRSNYSVKAKRSE